MAVQGKLISADSGYSGHTVELIARYLFDAIDEPVPLRFVAEARDDGRFEVELPDGREPAPSLAIRKRIGKELRRVWDAADLRARAELPGIADLLLREYSDRANQIFFERTVEGHTPVYTPEHPPA